MGFLKEVAKNSIRIMWNRKETGLLIFGVAAGVGATVAACAGTIKAIDIIEEHNEIKDMIKEAKEYPEKYSEQDAKQDTVKNYINTGKKLVLAYAPAAALGITSIFCIVAEHKMLQNKVTHLEETVASLSAAYAAIDTAFKNYRKRVVDKYGEEEDRYFMYGEHEEIVETEVVGKDGKTKKKKEKKIVTNDISDVGYARFITYNNRLLQYRDAQQHEVNWDRTINQIKCQQAWAQQKLEKNGYLFLNDVYEMLDLPKTEAGQVVGWIYDPENLSIDSEVDLGIYRPTNYQTVNGEASDGIWIDPNVDGVIIDKVPWYKGCNGWDNY